MGSPELRLGLRDPAPLKLIFRLGFSRLTELGPGGSPGCRPGSFRRRGDREAQSTPHYTRPSTRSAAPSKPCGSSTLRCLWPVSSYASQHDSLTLPSMSYRPIPFGPFFADRMGLVTGVATKPDILFQSGRVVTERVARRRVRPACVLPLRFRRQTIARPVPVRNSYLVPIDLLERRYFLPLTQLVAELHRVQPSDLLHGVPVGRLTRNPIPTSAIGCEKARIVAHDSLILRLGHFVNAQVEGGVIRTRCFFFPASPAALSRNSSS